MTIGGVSGSNLTSSLYNSANVISGLASGLDTEGMIEGLVKSYQTKIQNLTNKTTKLGWKQEAYRSIISKMYSFSSKYASYTSGTNLLSAAFFNNAIKVASLGKYKDAVTASGRTDSEIKVTSVKQLAASARYSTVSNLKGDNGDYSITADKAVNFSDDYEYGALSGNLTLTYGDKTVTITFDPEKDRIDDVVYKTDKNGDIMLDKNGKKIIDRERTGAEKAADLKKLIEEKLADSTVTLTSGDTRNAADLIDVSLSGGTISFKDKSSGGNNVYLSGASGTVRNTLGLELDNADEEKPNKFTVTNLTKLTRTESVASHISGSTMNITLDGKTKTINLPGLTEIADGIYNMTAAGFVSTLQNSIDKAFGAGKITVSNEAKGNYDLQLKFTAQNNSDLSITTDVGKALNMSNYSVNGIDTGKTLGELMDEGLWKDLEPAQGYQEGKLIPKDGKLYDAMGNRVNYARQLLDEDGNLLYSFSINGVTIGNYSKDTKLSTILADLNNNSEAGVKATYSQTTRKFTFTTKETGSEAKIEFGDDLAKAIFGNTSDVGNNFSKSYGLDLKDNEKIRVAFDVDDGTFVDFEIDNKTKMEDIVKQLNSSPMITLEGYKAEYDKNTNQIVVTDSSGKKVDFTVSRLEEDGSPGDVLEPVTSSASGYTPGQDAVLSVEVNGEELILKRGSNSFSLDGLTVNLQGTFNDDYIFDTGNGYVTVAENKPVGESVVTFQRTTDSDTIVDAIKSFVADFNEMLSEIRSQYVTLPYQNSSGKFETYEPLSDEDRATMTENAIQQYEEKAKQGLLFGDRDLSALYDKLRSVFANGGADDAKLRQMGLSISYSAVDGSASLTLDENKLRSVLESDPDLVTDVFTRSLANGGSDGVMQQLKSHLDTYGSTTGAVKGILVETAGTPLSSMTLMNNVWQKQIDNINNEITKWQDKLSAQVDKYTSMFSKLETLIYQMNAQSSSLYSLMGY